MKISKDEYIEKIQQNLDNLSAEVAGELFVLGSGQDFINDNDIFDAIHAYLGTLEVPVSDSEREESIAEIKKLIENYHTEKEAE
ncbi:hypothetical protein LJC07_06040 [Christensenellaceae bacterium OttesenSCG-928-L17]|nr:hypothetical protein [Christensenellaceae bacterium OttesenSCG-928-L17]